MDLTILINLLNEDGEWICRHSMLAQKPVFTSPLGIKVIHYFHGLNIHPILEIHPLQLLNWFCSWRVNVNVIDRFSSMSRSTRVTFKFQELRSLLEIAQKMFI